jgi:hypothetical protein
MALLRRGREDLCVASARLTIMPPLVLFFDRRRKVSAQRGLVGCYWRVEVAPEFRLHYASGQK